MERIDADVRNLLLVRQGLVFAAPGSSAGSGAAPRVVLQALEVELAALGFVVSARLAARLATLPRDQLGELARPTCAALAASLGANRKHEPLFRRFPDDVPLDTGQLWLQKVIAHFIQAPGQPCLFCRLRGTTHVLQPCCHVVCDRCFDGSNYSRCPVCEHAVDRSSPFFKESPAPSPASPPPPTARVRFKLLDLGEDLHARARELLLSLLARPQALSPSDRDALIVLLRGYGTAVLPWLPEAIPVRENVAHVLGTLLQRAPGPEVMAVARKYLGTATDVLRLLAAYSGADPALQGETLFKPARTGVAAGWVGKLLSAVQAMQVLAPKTAILVRRFKMTKLPRPLRRELLAFLDGLPREALCEDLLRHRSYWVWVGEFLHPHEYARRFPTIAHAFQLVRRKDPEGRRAPTFHGWRGRVESALRGPERESREALVPLLRQRPGELARRLDHALRATAGDPAPTSAVIEAFVSLAPCMTLPMLLTLASHFRHRTFPSRVRVYWPKGAVGRGVSDTDRRAPLAAATCDAIVRAIEFELLRRVSAAPALGDCIVDAPPLATIPVPFNERTASRAAAVALARGAQVALPPGPTLRLFLHWCQPEINGYATDLDLSVAFYDAAWNYVDMCSYSKLTYVGRTGARIAVSAGDIRDAPYPDGGTEFVDVDRALARAEGIRWAVMLVNSYAGMAFSQLERAWAGYMLRDSTSGPHFDPRTVEHKFSLAGENGVYVPLALDLDDGTMHWIDAYAKGTFALNNVSTSSKSITKICPALITYFASGERPSMRDLALLHAAGRGRRVFVRGPEGRGVQRFARGASEDLVAFYRRLRAGSGGTALSALPAALEGPVFAALLRGDVDLPEGSRAYALYRDRLADPVAASDLLVIERAGKRGG